MRKKVYDLCKDYIRLQYSSAQKVLGMANPTECHPTEYFVERASGLWFGERDFFNNYVKIGSALNTIMTYATGMIDDFLKGYFMLSASCLLRYVRDSAPEGKEIPDYIPIKRIPDANEDEWMKQIMGGEVFMPLIHFFAYKAMLKGLSQVFAPKGIDFSDLTYPENLIEEELSDLQKMEKGIFPQTGEETGIPIFDISTYRMSRFYSDKVKNNALGWDLSKGQIPLLIASFEKSLVDWKIHDLHVRAMRMKEERVRGES